MPPSTFTMWWAAGPWFQAQSGQLLLGNTRPHLSYCPRTQVTHLAFKNIVWGNKHIALPSCCKCNTIYTVLTMLKSLSFLPSLSAWCLLTFLGLRKQARQSPLSYSLPTNCCESSCTYHVTHSALIFNWRVLVHLTVIPASLMLIFNLLIINNSVSSADFVIFLFIFFPNNLLGTPLKFSFLLFPVF